MKSIKKKSILKEDEERMFAEMNILKDLDHPNILKLFELYQDENNYYLITEYIFFFKLNFSQFKFFLIQLNYHNLINF